MSSKISWETSSDWDNAQSENRILHENYTDTSSNDAQLGYPTYMNNLVALYPLDEGSGSTAYDYAGGYDGTYYNASPGASGGTLNLDSRATFDGSGHRIDLGSPSALNLNGTMTFASWVEIKSHRSVFTTWANGNYSEYAFHIISNDDGTIRYNPGADTDAVDSNTTISTNTRTFFSVSRDSNNNIHFYFNGSPDSGNPYSSTGDNKGDTYCTLGRESSQQSDMYQSYSMFFNDRLTDSEHKDLYDRASSGSITTARKIS